MTRKDLDKCLLCGQSISLFNQPDDFVPPDIFGDADTMFPLYLEKEKHRNNYPLDHETFTWTDIHGHRHQLKDIDDNYLSNIIKHLERGHGYVGPLIGRVRLIEFLKNELYRRISGDNQINSEDQ